MGRIGKPTPALPGEEGRKVVCRVCGAERPIEDFSWFRVGESRQTQCKGCANARGRENYRANRERYMRAARERNSSMRERLAAIKSGPCADCGQSYPGEVMEFDHLDPRTKTANVSNLIRHRVAWARIEAEITKCELVCANCHRLRTLARRGI